MLAVLNSVVVLRAALFWAITQRVVVIPYRSLGTTYRSYLKSGPIGCPEMSVRNYHYSLRNNPEECSSHLLLRGGGLKSRVVVFFSVYVLIIFGPICFRANSFRVTIVWMWRVNVTQKLYTGWVNKAKTVKLENASQPYITVATRKASVLVLSLPGIAGSCPACH
jgi:hypothetical protein